MDIHERIVWIWIWMRFFISTASLLSSSFYCPGIAIFYHVYSIYIVPKNGDNYTYTTGIDAKDTFLFCNTEDSSVQLYNIYWRRKDGISYHTNPLDVYTLRNILILTNNQEMECFDTESGNIIMSVELYVQGLLCIP